jgi:hypothetical protein
MQIDEEFNPASDGNPTPTTNSRSQSIYQKSGRDVRLAETFNSKSLWIRN